MNNDIPLNSTIENEVTINSKINWNDKMEKNILTTKTYELPNNDSRIDKSISLNEIKKRNKTWTNFENSINNSTSDVDNVDSENKSFNFDGSRTSTNTSDSGDENDDYDSSSISSSEAAESETERKNLLGDDDEIDHDQNILDSEPSSPIQSSSTPRPSSTLSSVYNMTSEQKAYYEKCFLHLQAACNGSKHQASLNGAVKGNSEVVMDFFEKSKLPPEELSRIWLLSDVNEDGFLNLEEFSMAMHLVVLRVKGGIKIPQYLPDDVRPREEEPRDNEFDESLTSSTTCSSNIEEDTKKSWKQSDELFIQQNKPCTNESFKNNEPEDNNDKKIICDSVMSNFSKTPPLIVDLTPRAKKSSNSPIIIEKIPTPSIISPNIMNNIDCPLPPPRPLNIKQGKGHGRSISLDTNALNAILDENKIYNNKNIEETKEVIFQSDLSNYNITQTDGFMKEDFFEEKPIKYCCDASAQTDTLTNTDFNELAKQLNALLNSSNDGESVFSKTSNDSFLKDSNLTFEERCHLLRKLNWELEKERSTLVQVRLQLQLRLEELEKESNKSKEGNNAKKPTQL
uniref:RalBP1-associated Eps domain-containing protein 1 n=1 Tax=Parastrongyloides trichosuri TaxID=131310 RepID=A0A0N4Z7A5_PARTI